MKFIFVGNSDWDDTNSDSELHEDVIRLMEKWGVSEVTLRMPHGTFIFRGL